MAPPRGAAEDPYALALLDWLACARAGRAERAAQAMRSCGEGLLAEVAFAGAAGHALDFDDTFPDGVAHVSAACAPAALVLAAALGRSAGEALAAYAQAFEAEAAVAEASHPALYDAGWHPTAVCGPVGAAVAACALLGLGGERAETALAAALLRAGGARGAFGSDGKALQVGQAAAAGVEGALLARAGAVVDERAVSGPLGWEAVTGARMRPAPGARPAIERNWIKLHPSCLGTHAPIEAALLVRGQGRAPADLADSSVHVRVNPLARQAAHIPIPSDGLQAKFSIPWCVAFTLMRGAPGVADFAADRALDPEVLRAARSVEVVQDPALAPFGAVLELPGAGPVAVPAPRGAPDRPASAADLAGKLQALAGGRLDGVLAELQAPAAAVLAAAGLAPGPPAP